jgi:1-phosphatidylinositol phosphodiesterase
MKNAVLFSLLILSLHGCGGDTGDAGLEHAAGQDAGVAMSSEILQDATGLPPNPHGQNDSYSTSTGAIEVHDRESWMNNIPNNTALLDMSIPGSHLSWWTPNEPVVSDDEPQYRQNFGLQDQLSEGLRAFDLNISCSDYYSNPECGFETTETAPGNDYSWGTRLESPTNSSKGAISNYFASLQTFLTAHPSEVVIVRLTQGSPNDLAAVSLKDWGKYVLAMIKKTAPNIWFPSSQAEANLVTLNEVRGKIVVLRDWNGTVTGDGAEIETYGMNMHNFVTASSLFPKHFGGIGDLYDWWTNVKSHLELVAAWHHDTGSGLGAMTYLTGYGGVYPYFVASGYASIDGRPLSTGKTTTFFKDAAPDFARYSCSEKNGKGICSIYYTGVNILLADALTGANSNSGHNNSAMKSMTNLGIVMSDFPGYALIDAIRGKNSLCASSPC